MVHIAVTHFDIGTVYFNALWIAVGVGAGSSADQIRLGRSASEEPVAAADRLGPFSSAGGPLGGGDIS